MRNIEDVLNFRQDISPFLVHLTRQRGARCAREVLCSILDEPRRLIAGETEVSDARFGGRTQGMSAPDKRALFGAVCFTETPLAEAHCLLEIERRQVDLEPYGIVCLKDSLQQLGVAPVFYINNALGDMDDSVQALFSLKDTNRSAAERLLPLVSVFGQRFIGPGAAATPGNVDWRWEREWRFAASRGELTIDPNHVFIGLCPDDEIEFFERRYQGDGEGEWPYQLGFIDPRRNMKWYAKKLIEARQRVNLSTSVV